MRFLLDENVAGEVGEWLSGRGYEVLYSRDVTGVSAPDEILAFLIEMNGLIIVTHDNDFKQLRRQLPPGHVRRVTNGAGRICLSVRENRAKARLEEIWDVIEFNYERQARLGERFIIRVSQSTYLVTTNSGK